MKRKFPKCQQGVSLPIALILLIPLTMLGITMANRNNLEEMMAGSQLNAQQSLMNAETGLALGSQLLDQMVTAQIALNDPDLLNADSMLTLAVDPTALVYGDVDLSGYSLDQGAVTVVLMDNNDDGDPTTDSDDRIILRSTGSYGNYMGGERVVEAIVELKFTATADDEDSGGNSSLPPLTIFSEDILEINDKARFYGPRVHSNDKYSFGGEPQVYGRITQSSSSNSKDAGKVDPRGDGTGLEMGVAPIATPYVYPPVYKGVATRYLTSDCKVYDGPPGAVGTTRLKSNVDKYDGWECKGEDDAWTWLLKEDTTSGFYYVEGSVESSGSIGSSGNPLKISIVAEGHINVSGETYITPFYTSEDDVDFTNETSEDELSNIDDELVYETQYDTTLYAKDHVLQTHQVLLLAGGDIKIEGQFHSNFGVGGVIATHNYFDISGEGAYEGGVFSEGNRYGGFYDFFDNFKNEKYLDADYNVIATDAYFYGSAELGGPGESEPEEEPEEGEPIRADIKGWREVIQ